MAVKPAPSPAAPAADLRSALQEAPERLPKYARFAEALRACIDGGTWSTGDCLPTETELASLSGLSLGTVQRGIGLLVDQGRLRRVRGRGTFVAESPRMLARPFMHLLFRGGDGEVLPIQPRAATHALVSERGPWSEVLGQQGNNIFRVDRVVQVGRALRVLSRFFINADRFPWFTRLSPEELTTSNYKLLLLQRHNLPEIAFEQGMRLGPVPAGVAKAIGVPRGGTACTLGVTARSPDGAALYYHQMVIPPNGLELHLPGITLRARR
ncbi:MAG TPA: GntR family transcriptional regulator [Ramlibacter sp.]|nr:GntR family transcriptional regulator [Ramlibacter sp.]